jgi:hypothetical protein
MRWLMLLLLLFPAGLVDRPQGAAPTDRPPITSLHP